MGSMKKSAFRFRLYPNRKQEQRMLTMVEAGRRLWNDALAHRKQRWEEKRLSTSYSQQCWILTGERRVNPLFRELYSQAGQEILHRLDRHSQHFSSIGRDTRDSRSSHGQGRSPTSKHTTGQ